MSESSESDIIQRSKHTKRRHKAAVEDLFESSSSYSSESVSEQAYDPVFYEIFGTGKEYSYIYDNSESKSTDNPSKPSEKYIGIDDCYEYIRKVSLPSISKVLDKDVVKKLINGYSPEYISFHCDKMQLRDAYAVEDYVEEYKEYMKVKDTRKNIDNLRGYTFYKEDQKNLNIPGLLNIDEYMSNIISQDRVYEPSGPVEGEEFVHLNFTEEESKILLIKTFSKVINQIANNPVFKDRVFRYYECKIVDPSDMKSCGLEVLTRFYTTDMLDSSNSIRSFIIAEAFSRVKVSEEEIREKFELKGFGKAGMQEMADLIVSIKGMEGTYAGLFLDKKSCRAVVLDDQGDLVKKAVFKENEYEAIREFISGINTVCVSANSFGIRYFIQNMKSPMLYVPRSLAFFNDHKDFSIPFCIASVVQNPAVYFSRLFYSTQNNLKDSLLLKQNSKEKEYFNIYKLLENYEYRKSLKRSIRLALAANRLDWRALLNHKFSFTLLDVCNITLNDKYFDYEKIDRLENLRSAFDVADYYNLTSLFKLSSSKNPLDKTCVHPRNYSLANILCKGAYMVLINKTGQQEQSVAKSDEKIVEIVLGNLSCLGNIDIPEDDDKDPVYVSGDLIRRMLMNQKSSSFTGATDQQIFDDVVPMLDNSFYSGVISKVGSDFYLAEVQGATVYIKKNAEYALNQIVDIQIIGQSTQMLSYNGEIIEQKMLPTERFRKHQLFRNLDQSKIQELSMKESIPILVRPSSQQGCCSVVCRIEGDLFFNFRLLENKDGYEFNSQSYQSIDDFIHRYIAALYQSCYNIKKFKYFYEDESKAIEYIRTPGDYAKYALFFSRKNPGYLEVIFGNRKIVLKIEDKFLIFRNKRFGSVEEFARFLKANYNSL